MAGAPCCRERDNVEDLCIRAVAKRLQPRNLFALFFSNGDIHRLTVETYRIRFEFESVRRGTRHWLRNRFIDGPRGGRNHGLAAEERPFVRRLVERFALDALAVGFVDGIVQALTLWVIASIVLLLSFRQVTQ